MESISLSNHTRYSLALYYKSVDETIFKEERFIQLMNMLLSNKVNTEYAFYTDSFLLRTNLYVPNFHTMYLASGNHNVIIGDSEDIWLLDVFKNNKYYILDNNKEDKFDYESKGIKKISHIKSIGENNEI